MGSFYFLVILMWFLWGPDSLGQCIADVVKGYQKAMKE